MNNQGSVCEKVIPAPSVITKLTMREVAGMFGGSIGNPTPESIKARKNYFIRKAALKVQLEGFNRGNVARREAMDKLNRKCDRDMTPAMIQVATDNNIDRVIKNHAVSKAATRKRFERKNQ